MLALLVEVPGSSRRNDSLAAGLMMGERGQPDRHEPAAPMQPDLVVRASTGDREAFSHLAAASFDQLFRTARLILAHSRLVIWQLRDTWMVAEATAIDLTALESADAPDDPFMRFIADLRLP